MDRSDETRDATPPLTERKAAEILDRAAKLDAAGGLVSMNELRAVALEAGISREAFERAVAEVEGAQTTSVVSGPGRERAAAADEGGRSWWRRLGDTLRRTVLFGVGSVLAVFAFILSDMGVDGTVALSLALFGAGLVFAHIVLGRRKSREIWQSVFDIAALWFGLTVILLVGEPGSARELLNMFMIPFGVSAGVLGALIAATGPVEDESRELPGPTVGHLPERT